MGITASKICGPNEKQNLGNFVTNNGNFNSSSISSSSENDNRPTFFLSTEIDFCKSFSLNNDSNQFVKAINLINAISKGYKFRKFFESNLKDKLKVQRALEIDNLKLKFNQIGEDINKKLSFNKNSYLDILEKAKDTAIFNKDQKLKNSLEHSIKQYTVNQVMLGFTINECCILKKDTYLYIGSVNKYNEKHGFGILYKINGSKYEGLFIKNKFTGWGRYIDSSENYYEGFFSNFSLNSFGCKISKNNSQYIGCFKNDQKHHIGYEETSEHKYEGNFSGNLKHGFGKLTFKDSKDVYEGKFIKNSITGIGVYHWENSSDLYKGEFLNGKMHGPGEYLWKNGDIYYGNYYNGVKSGPGKIFYQNGRILECVFRNGKPEGLGRLIINEENYEVEFEDGVLVQTISNLGNMKIDEYKRIWNEEYKKLTTLKSHFTMSSISRVNTYEKDGDLSKIFNCVIVNTQ